MVRKIEIKYSGLFWAAAVMFRSVYSTADIAAMLGISPSTVKMLVRMDTGMSPERRDALLAKWDGGAELDPAEVDREVESDLREVA